MERREERAGDIEALARNSGASAEGVWRGGRGGRFRHAKEGIAWRGIGARFLHELVTVAGGSP